MQEHQGSSEAAAGSFAVSFTQRAPGAAPVTHRSPPTPSCSSISPGFSSQALCARPHLVQGKGCLKHLLLHQVLQLLWEQSTRDRVRFRDLGRWSRGAAGSCSANLPASGCSSKLICLSSLLFYPPQDGRAHHVAGFFLQKPGRASPLRSLFPYLSQMSLCSAG